MRSVSSESFASSNSGLCGRFLGMPDLRNEEFHKFPSQTNGAFSLSVAHAGLSIIPRVPQPHQVGQGARKAGRDNLPPSDKTMDKVVMHPFVGPLFVGDSLTLQGANRCLKCGKIGAADCAIEELLLQTELSGFERPLGSRPIHEMTIASSGAQASSSNSAFASLRSAVSNPSVNQP